MDRRVMHSIYFREPDKFTGKITLAVDAGGSGVDTVIQRSGNSNFLATEYNYRRFPFLDLSGPYNQPSRELRTDDRRGIITTNAPAHSHSENDDSR